MPKYEYICASCGGPRSVGSGQTCAACYQMKCNYAALIRDAEKIIREQRRLIVGIEKELRRLKLL